MLKLFHRGADAIGYRNGIRARRLENRDGNCLLIIEERTQTVCGSVDLDPRHIVQVRDHAILVLDDDLAELLGIGQPALDIDGKLQLALCAIGRPVHETGGHLHVLAAHGVDNVVGAQSEFGDLLRVKPQAHGVVARAE